jgi:hypothetical protein
MNLLLKKLALAAETYQIPTANLVGLYWFNDGSGQVLTDSSGGGHDGQLGSATGADSADPAWTARGLQFGGNDYVLIPYAPSLEADFTAYVAAVVAGTPPASDNEAYFGAGNSGTDTPRLLFYRAPSGSLTAILRNNAGANVEVSIAAGSVTPGVRLLRVQRASAKLTIRDVGAAVTSGEQAAPASPIAVNQMSFGALVRASGDYYSNQEIYAAALYSRATTDDDDAQVFGKMAAVLAVRGVVLA